MLYLQLLPNQGWADTCATYDFIIFYGTFDKKVPIWSRIHKKTYKWVSSWKYDIVVKLDLVKIIIKWLYDIPVRMEQMSGGWSMVRHMGWRWQEGPVSKIRHTYITHPQADPCHLNWPVTTT